MILVDTAGIRRRGQVKQGIERYSVLRALKAIERCDIAFLVMDATLKNSNAAIYIISSEPGMLYVGWKL